MRLHRVKGTLALASLALVSIPVHATWYITDLGTPDFSYGEALDINNQGQIVGRVVPKDLGGGTAFIYDGGTMYNLGAGLSSEFSSAYSINTSGHVVGEAVNQAGFSLQSGQTGTLPTLGGLSSRAYGLNDAGQIVGASSTRGYSADRAFLFSDGKMQNLGSLGGDHSVAIGINNNGIIAGFSYLDNGNAHAFEYRDGSIKDLGTLGGANSFATAINQSGQIVGYAETGQGTQAFLYSEGRMSDIGSALGGARSQAYDINNRNQVVGTNWDASGQTAFLYSEGTFLNLSTLPEVLSAGWHGLEALAINDIGDIVGRGELNGAYHAFVLSPNQWFASPVTAGFAPEIDGSKGLLGLALLGGALSFLRRRPSASDNETRASKLSA